MDTKALRQKILDLAIRGKLVPQDPNDEPASVLLERIRAEKQQMVKDGKLKAKDIKNDTIVYKGDDNLHYEKFPDGSVKCIEDEIPFELPQGWEWARIRNIATVKGGKRLPKGMSFSENPTEHAYIRVTDMKNNSINTTDLKYISDDVYEKIKTYTISKSDLYVTIAGTIGEVGEVPDVLDGMNLTENAVKVTDIFINKTFLCILIQSALVQQQFIDKTHQVAMPKLALERILSTLIPICPLNEQHRIVDKLNELLLFVNTIETDKTTLQDLIKQTKSKILDLAIRGKLVPQDPNDEPASVLLERIRAEKEELIKQGKIKRDKKESVIFKGEDNSYYEKIGSDVRCIDEELPFEVPENWSWCRLSNACIINPKNNTDDDLPVSFVPMTLIKDGYSNQFISEQRKWKEVKKGFTHFAENDVGFAKITPCFENRKSVVFRNLYNEYGAGTTELYILRALPDTLLPEYLLYIVKSEMFISGGKQSFSGAVGQQRVDKEYVNNYLCPVPPLSEQIKITSTLQKYIDILEEIEKSLS